LPGRSLAADANLSGRCDDRSGQRQRAGHANVPARAPPPRDDALIAVAAYGNGVAFHRADTFASLGILATGGAPSDVAFDAEGTLSATDTDGDALTQASLAPWGVRAIPSVPEGDEIAVDPRTQDVLTTNRDVDGSGALTRVGHDGTVSRVATGATAEGLAVDSMHDRTYVADVNDGSVAVVRTSTMRVIGKISTVARDFSLALSADGSRLYVVSNQSLGSPFGAAGRVVAIALDAAKPHAVAISAALEFRSASRWTKNARASSSPTRPRTACTSWTQRRLRRCARRSRPARCRGNPRSIRSATVCTSRARAATGWTCSTRARSRALRALRFARPSIRSPSPSGIRRRETRAPSGAALAIAWTMLATSRSFAAELPARLDPPSPFPAILSQAPAVETIAPGIGYAEYALVTADGRWSCASPRSRHIVPTCASNRSPRTTA